MYFLVIFRGGLRIDVTQEDKLIENNVRNKLLLEASIENTKYLI
jgi:hypothetical protein